MIASSSASHQTAIYMNRNKQECQAQQPRHCRRLLKGGSTDFTCLSLLSHWLGIQGNMEWWRNHHEGELPKLKDDERVEWINTLHIYKDSSSAF